MKPKPQLDLGFVANPARHAYLAERTPAPKKAKAPLSFVDLF